MSRGEVDPLAPLCELLQELTTPKFAPWLWRGAVVAGVVLLAVLAALCWLAWADGGLHLLSAASATAVPLAHGPAPRATTAGGPLVVSIVGKLCEDAELRLAPRTNLPRVTLLLGQSGRVPVSATELFGEGNAAYHAAHAKACLLRRGARVEVRGEGLHTAHHPRHARLVCFTAVHSVRLLDPPFDAAMAAANDAPSTTKGDLS